MKDLAKKNVLWAAGILAAILLLSLAALAMGRYQIPVRQVLAVLFPGLPGAAEVTDNMRNTVLNVRLPRILLSLLAGAGLSAAGAAFQALFANPLATPDTLGVATGASFGAVFAILLGLSGIMTQVFALGAGVLAVGLVYLVSADKRSGRSSIVMIVLAGMVVSALFSALVSLVKYVADPQDVLPAITFWLMGSLSGITAEKLMLGAPFILAGLVILYLCRWKLNVMTLTEEEAASLGVRVKLVRAVVILGAAMVTASVVSLCGVIGWVGLLIPHISRMIFGSNNQRVMPASMGLGAVFMLVIDTVARCATAAEIPVSILTAVIGAPFFILLLRKTGGLPS